MAEQNGRVSQRQIAIVSGLVFAVAGGVAGFCVMVYGGQLELQQASHGAELSRMQELMDTTRASCESTIALLETSCGQRVAEVKETSTRLQDSLSGCLSRPLELQLTVDPPEWRVE